ncbi:septum formation initiator family protein [Actinomycetaceae bacterium L2_0104]
MSVRRTPPSGSQRRPSGRPGNRDARRRPARPENAARQASDNLAASERARLAAKRKPEQGRPANGRPSPDRSGPRNAPRSATDGGAERPRKERFTSQRHVVIGGRRGSRQFSLRILAIVLTAIVAAIIVTPTVTNYYSHQRELAAARAELVDIRDRNEDLENQLKLWNDDDYVRAQARERLGWVAPGQTLYTVNDPSEGTAQEQLEQRIESVNRDRLAATPWFMTMWDSIDVAGQSAADFDNPNNAPVIDPSGEGTISPEGASGVPAGGEEAGEPAGGNTNE